MNCDGLVGLTPTEIGDESQDLFMATLFSQGLIKSLVFSVYLGSTKQQSFIWFGGYAKPLNGSISWISIVRSSHWELSLSKVAIN
jgi:hypothetical protein